MGDKISISCERKDVDSSRSEPYNGSVKFALVNKTNTLKSYLKHARKNKQIVKGTVKEANIKNYTWLIKAFSEIKKDKRFDDLKLVIAGRKNLNAEPVIKLIEETEDVFY